ncbi:MAG: YdcH family protein [Pseudomonadota bacterium]
MSDQDQAEVRLLHARLKQDHADFDAAIEAMNQTGCNPLQIQRMKKKKLAIKDQLQKIEDQLIPDVIA